MEKLAIDKKLLAQILQEENRTHDAAIRELEEKIANVEQQMKPSLTVENIQSETPIEPAREMPESSLEVSDNANEDVSVDALNRAEVLLQESDSTPAETEVEAPQEAPKKKKRGLF